MLLYNKEYKKSTTLSTLFLIYYNNKMQQLVRIILHRKIKINNVLTKDFASNTSYYTNAF